MLFKLVFSNLFVRGQQTNCPTLQGKVIELGTGKAIQEAVVFLPGLNRGTRTDSNGYFEIKNVCTTNTELRIQHLNHSAFTEQVSLQVGNNFKTYYLACHHDTFHEVTIKQSRIHWEDVIVSNTLQGEELSLQQGSSLGKMLEKIPGVTNLNTGNTISKPVIRGLHSNRVIILNNGIRQEGQQWGSEHAPEIDPNIAKSIEVIKGSQSLRYGSDIIGGLILVKPASLFNIQCENGEINLQSNSNGGMLALGGIWQGNISKVKGLTYRVQGAFKKGGNGATPNYYLNNTGVDEKNYSIGIGYDRKKWQTDFFYSSFSTQIGIYAGSHIGNLTDLYRAFENERPLEKDSFSYRINFPYQDVSHKLYKIQIQSKTNNFLKPYFVYAFQNNNRKEYDKSILVKNKDGSYRPVLDFNLKTHQFDIGFEHKSWKQWTGGFGVNGFFQRNEYFGNYFIPNYDKLQGGLYWAEKWHRNKLSFDAGIRYDINTFEIAKWEKGFLIRSSYFFHGSAASISGRYQFPFINIHTHLSTAWRAPFVNELYSYGIHQSTASFEIGNPSLQPERSYNASLTVDINLKNRFNAEITAFNNYINNFISAQPSMPATLTIRGAFPTFLYQQFNTNFSGIEYASNLLLHKNVRFITKANLLWVKNVAQNRYLVGMPPASLDASFESYIVLKKSAKIIGNIGMQYVAAQSRVETNSDYVLPPNAYHLVHAELTCKPGKKLENYLLQVGIQNALNREYREYLNRNRYFANELGRNFYLKIHIPIQIKRSNNKTI